MSRGYRALASTPDVEEAQRVYGSRAAQERLDRRDGPAQAPEPLGGVEREFVALQDGFYVATVSTTGWPHVQFRGGSPGFVRTPDPHTLAWGDLRGNRQYITTGNVRHDPRVALIFLDHARRARWKGYGCMRVTDVRDRPSTLAVAGYPGIVDLGFPLHWGVSVGDGGGVRPGTAGAGRRELTSLQFSSMQMCVFPRTGCRTGPVP